MLTFINSLIGRIAIGVGISMLAAIAFLWFQNGHLRTRAESAEDAAAIARKETDSAQTALTAAENRAANRRTNDATQRQDEDTINAQPETYVCADSPAVRSALDLLRQREAIRDAAGDPAEPS